MKKYILSIISILIITTICAQMPATSFTLDEPVQSNVTRDWVAGEFVKMTYSSIPPPGTGFSAAPDINNFVKASIDPLYIGNPDEGDGSGGPPNNNTSGIVGSISGSFSVSPTGAATYSVPIKVAPGTSGMVPEIGIVYNSQISDGLLGAGWSLTGISAITRSASSYYYDDKMEAITFPDQLPALSLDGMRILKVADNADGTKEYRTETDNMYKILAYFDTEGNLDRFKIFTKSGLTKEYGFTTNSKQILGDNCIECDKSPMAWYLNMVTDNVGNYIEYTYLQDKENGEILPNEIHYTGNEAANLDPYNTIKFTYTNRIYNKTSYFKAALGTKEYVTSSSTKYLSHISCKSSGLPFRNYDMYYTQNGVSNQKYLRKIYVQDGYWDMYNPLVFDWQFIKEDEFKIHRSSLTGNFTSDQKYPNIIPGDFNYNGRTDFVNTWYDDINNKWKFAVNYDNPANPKHYTQKAVRELPSGYRALNVMDFNGDGESDFVTTSVSSGSYEFNCFIGDKSEDDGVIGPFAAFTEINTTDEVIFYNGDYNGDGIGDILIRAKHSPTKDMLYYYKGTTSGLPSEYFTREIFNYFSGIPMDTDGDGKSELFLYNNTGDEEYSYILDLNSEQTEFTCNEVSITDIVEENDRVVSGDFNGDRKGDLLVICETGCWKTYFAIGNDFITGPLLQKDAPGNDIYTSGDFNNDGITDVAAIPNYGNTSWNGIKIWLTRDDVSEYVSVAIDQTEFPLNNSYTRLYFGDYNGNGRTDYIALEGDHSSPVYNIYEILAPGDFDHKNLVNNITNGTGNDFSIRYTPLTDYSVYSKKNEKSVRNSDNTENEDYPLSGFVGALYVVQTTEHDINTGTDRHGYNYKAASTHRYGKGFLGFLQVTKTNLNTAINKTDMYHLNTEFFYQEYAGSLVYKGDINMPYATFESTQNVIDYKVNINNGKIFTPYIKKSATYLYDNNVIAKTSKTESECNSYGDCLTFKYFQHPGYMHIDYPDESYDFREITTNTYLPPDLDNWVLGRLENASVTTQINVEPGEDPQPDITRNSKFEYYTPSGHQHYGMLWKETVEPLHAHSTTKEYTYDVYGNIIKTKTSATGMPDIISESNYDTDLPTAERKGRFLTWSKNPEGHITTKTHNQRTGNVSTSTDPNGLTTSFYYNSFGIMNRTVLPDGVQSKVLSRWVDQSDPGDAPDDAIYLIWSKSSGNPASVTYYNKLNKPLRLVTTGFNGHKLYKDITYNNKGLVFREYDAYFSNDTPFKYVEYEYDERNRVLKKTVQPDDRITSYAYTGLSTTVTNPLSQTSTSETNAAGWLISKTDNDNNEIKYVYGSSGNLKETYIEGHPETLKTTTYDLFGRSKVKTDPALGTTEYIYDAYSNVVTRKHNGVAEADNLQYDKLGRIIHSEEPGVGTTNWTYDVAHIGVTDLVSFIDSDGNLFSNNYSYDTYGRMLSNVETVGYDGETDVFNTSYVYDVFGRAKQLYYPSGFSITYEYDQSGVLKNVIDDTDGKILWTLSEMNAAGQIKEYNLGNGLSTYKGYWNTGFLKDIITDFPNSSSANKVQNMNYGWDDIGNLEWREKRWNYNQQQLKESFYYDGLNRLTQINMFNGYDVITTNADYDELGRILKKESEDPRFHFAHNFVYDGDGDSNPYNVYQIDNVPPYYKGLLQNITYTSFDKISSIIQEDKSLDIIYGRGHSRKVQITTDGSTGFDQKKIYVGGIFEKITENNVEKQVHYISAGDGLFAIHTIEVQNTSSNIMYIHKDHLGSIQVITDEEGNVVDEYSYDAWGLRRNAYTWVPYETTQQVETDRGFTGHEHLDLFSLINMNGRVYDPVIGSFLSPDPIGTSVMHSQGFNPYVYCMNNPLSFVDPSGYWNISLGESWHDFAILAIGTVATIATAGTAGAIFVPAIIGYYTSTYQATINGASYNDIRAAGIRGFLGGLIQGAGAYGIGQIYGNVSKVFAKELSRAIAHGIVQGTSRLVQGGKFEHGFFAGFVSSISSSAGYNIATAKNATEFQKNMAAYVLPIIAGGTAEALGGGNFANGAFSAAYVVLLNHMVHNNKPNNQNIPDDELVGPPRDVSYFTELVQFETQEEMINALEAWSLEAQVEMHGVELDNNGTPEYYILPAKHDGPPLTYENDNETSYFVSEILQNPSSKRVRIYHTHLTANKPGTYDSRNAYTYKNSSCFVIALKSKVVYKTIPHYNPQSGYWGNSVGTIEDLKNGIKF